VRHRRTHHRLDLLPLLGLQLEHPDPLLPVPVEQEHHLQLLQLKNRLPSDEVLLIIKMDSLKSSPF